MNIRKRAERLAGTVFKALEVSPSQRQVEVVTDIIEQGFRRTVRDHGELCAKVALESGSAAPHTANRIAAEIRETAAALIANLSSLR